MILTFAKRMLQIGALAAMVLAATVGPALAHVELASSTPRDGETATSTPTTIELEFTVEAEIAGEGFVLASSDGTVIVATVTQTSPTKVSVQPAEPLANGTYGVMWTMKAGDAHPATGTVTFGIAGPVTADADPQSIDRNSDFDTAPTEGTSTEPLQPVFTDVSRPSDVGDWTTRIGRWAAMSAGLVAIGAFAFAATSLVGTRREVEGVGYWLRRAGIVVVVGTAMELIGVSLAMATTLGSGFTSAVADTMSGSYGVALLLRTLAGLALLHGTSIFVTEAPEPVVMPPRGPTAKSAVAVRARTVQSETSRSWRMDVHREGYAIAGLTMFVVSFLFDGHTVTATPTAVVRIADLVHVAAAGVWVGGVAFMASLLASRKRRDVPLDGASIAIRFSTVAAAALAAVGVAGGILTVAILDNIGELFTTDWGRILVIKILAVGAVAAIGGYNHFRVVPKLERDPDDSAANRDLSTLVRTEAWVLIGVIGVTAILVGAAS